MLRSWWHHDQNYLWPTSGSKLLVTYSGIVRSQSEHGLGMVEILIYNNTINNNNNNNNTNNLFDRELTCQSAERRFIQFIQFKNAQFA